MILIHVLKFISYFVTDIRLRLQGPSSTNGTGRLEVLHKGEWGTICDNSWSTSNANVACRQLGYSFAVRVLPSGQVPDGNGQIWLDDVLCTGNELSLAHCSHNGWGNHNCAHSMDVGIECAHI